MKNLLKKEDKDFILGILSSASAKSINEKIEALTFLKTIQVTVAKRTWKVMAEKAATLELTKEAGIIAI